TRLVERVFPEFDVPRHGRLTGRAGLEGTARAIQIDADLAFDDEEGGTSRVVATGGVGWEPRVRFSNLLLRFLPLRAELVRAAEPRFPLRGVIEGSLRLTGTWDEVLSLDGDLAFDDPRAPRSRVRATGRVD